MAVASHRNDPAAFRHWWQQARRIAMAQRHTLRAALHRRSAGTTTEHLGRAAELIEHYERLLPEGRSLGIPTLSARCNSRVSSSAPGSNGTGTRTGAVVARTGAERVGGSVRTGAYSRPRRMTLWGATPSEPAPPRPRVCASPTTKDAPVISSTSCSLPRSFARPLRRHRNRGSAARRGGSLRRPARPRWHQCPTDLSGRSPSRGRRPPRRSHRRPTGGPGDDDRGLTAYTLDTLAAAELAVCGDAASDADTRPVAHSARAGRGPSRRRGSHQPRDRRATLRERQDRRVPLGERLHEASAYEVGPISRPMSPR